MHILRRKGGQSTINDNGGKGGNEKLMILEMPNRWIF